MIHGFFRKKWTPVLGRPYGLALFVYLAIYLIVIFLDFLLGGFIRFYFNPVIFHYVSLIIIILLLFANTQNRRRTIRRTDAEKPSLYPSIPHHNQEEENVSKNKWFYTTILIVIFGLGTFLRLYHLGELSPAGDEYRHLLAMKRLFTDGIFGYNISHITTLIIAGIKKITGSDSLFLMRLPFALLGSGSILLFYFIGKRIANKSVGLIAAYLFAFLPLAIGLSRYIRGYELALFVSLAALYFLLSTLAKPTKPTPGVSRSDVCQDSSTPGVGFAKIALFVLGLKLIAYLNSDPRFDAMVMSFAIFAIFYGILTFIDSAIKNKLWNKISKIAAPIAAFAGGIATLPLFFEFSLQAPQWDYLFLINHSYSDVTWYFELIPWVIIVFFLAIPFLVKIKKKNIIYALSFILVFVLFVFVFYFEGAKRFQVRYLYFLFPYFILLISIGAYSAYKRFRSVFNVRTVEYTIVSLIVFFTIFSPVKAFYFTFTQANGESNRMSQLAYYDTKKLLAFIDENDIDVSKTLTTQPWIFDYHYNQPFLKSGELDKYVHFPKDWNYEFINRTRIWSVSGYWAQKDIETINQLIKEEDIDYLVFHALPQEEDLKYKYTHPLETIKNIELLKIIDEDKKFGYYIYKVKKSEIRNSKFETNSKS